MTTLVTGAAGHLGNNLVRALVDRGEPVRAMVRRGGAREALDDLRARLEVVEADLRDPASLREAVDGCDRVFHCAAHISIRSGARRELEAVNVAGVRQLLDAARDAGVRRVVHTSSFGAMATRTDGRPSTEADHLGPFERTMDYERSKAEGEREVLHAVVRGLEVVVVNPSACIGPFDFRPSLMGATILDFARGKLPAYIPGAFDFVPMRDVVAAHLAAMERGRPGERYLVSGEVVPVRTMMGWLAELTGRPAPRLEIPPAVLLPVAMVQDWVDRRFFPERTPRFNEHTIRLLTSGKHGSNERAQRELGLRPTPVRDAFADAVAWFRGRGLLP